LEMARLHDIEKTTKLYHEQIRKRVAQSHCPSSAEAIIIKCLDRYAKQLFGHPAT
jgi:hypothetical protein